jgi:tetraacyldisaccharide 4'-kinase
VDSKDDAWQVGDEAKMLAESGVAVFVGKDRARNMKRAEKAGFSYIILDDGFQNPLIEKDLSLLVFDTRVGDGNGFLLPAGPLRETTNSALRRADALIFTGAGRAVHLRADKDDPTFCAVSETKNPGVKGPVMAFTGLGYPHKFFDAVAKMKGVRLADSYGFRDHHHYPELFLEMITKKADSLGITLLTTEKDWVKFPGKYRKKIKFAPMTTAIEPAFWRWLTRALKKIEGK